MDRAVNCLRCNAVCNWT